MAASNKIISELTDLQYIRSANTRFFKRRRVIVSSFVIVTTLIVTAAGLMLFGKSATTNQQRQPSLVAGLSKPNFNPILPTGGPMYNDQESSVKFSSATDSYSFDDTFLGAPILVFEQPLQTNKQSSADQLISTIASKIGANVPLNYSYGTAYLTGSSASNKQMLIFNDNGILVFIQSKLNIEANAWPQYIDKLYHA